MNFFDGGLPLLLAFLLAAGTCTVAGAAGDPGDDGRPDGKFSGRLVLVPTAVPPEAGEVVLSLHELFFPTIVVGLTERLSVSGGASVVPGSGAGVTFLSPRFTAYRGGGFDAACGVWMFRKAGGGFRGIGYANLTVGGHGESLTLGAGYGIRRAAEAHGLFLTGGGCLQVTGETDMLCEVVLPPGLDPALATLGTRFTSGNLAAEVAVIIPWGVRGFRTAPVPWTSVSLRL